MGSSLRNFMPPTTGYLSTIAQIKAFGATDRVNGYTRLVQGADWYSWFTYDSSLNVVNDDYLYIVPTDGVGAWKRSITSRRLTALYTTGTLLSGVTENGLIELALSYEILRVTTSVAARVRLYSTTAYRSADALRNPGTDPIGEHGVTLDVVTTADNLSLDMTRNPPGSNLEAVPSNEIPVAIANLSASSAAVTVTIVYLPTEF